MVEDTKKKGFFEKIDDPSQVDRLVLKLLSESPNTRVSVKGGDEIAGVQLSDVKGSHLIQITPTKGQGPAFESLRKKAASGSLICQFVSYLHGETVVGYRCKLASEEPGVMRFDRPEEFYQLERRSHPRLILSEGYEIYLQIRVPRQAADEERKYESRRLIDMSLGGLSFFVPDEEVCVYEKDMKLPSVEFRLRQKLAQLSAVVRHIAPFMRPRNEKGTRVGIEIEKMSNSAKELITQFLMERL